MLSIDYHAVCPSKRRNIFETKITVRGICCKQHARYMPFSQLSWELGKAMSALGIKAQRFRDVNYMA